MVIQDAASRLHSIWLQLQHADLSGSEVKRTKPSLPNLLVALAGFGDQLAPFGGCPFLGFYAALKEHQEKDA
jgi:hypothetical protein